MTTRVRDRRFPRRVYRDGDEPDPLRHNRPLPGLPVGGVLVVGILAAVVLIGIGLMV